MKTFLLILIVFFSFISNGQEKEKLTVVPKTIEETFPLLDQMIDDTVLYNFYYIPEDLAVGRLYFLMGTTIRIKWGLWEEGELKDYFLNIGVKETDQMCSIIFTSYYRYLKDENIDLNDQLIRVKEYYKTHPKDSLLENGTRIPYTELCISEKSRNEYKNSFPIGSNIIANLSFSYGMYSEFPPIIVTGITIEFREDELIVEVKSIEKGSKWTKKKPEIGDQISVNPYNCSLIPPTDWNINN